ncbi:MAG: endo-1,4-beta-xylanase, partial [Planctomycetes bacterium]|nr:endo-1,4-beta-xylanase [Planctomycetota bacterium]
WMFQAANAIDPDCGLFLNDYNVINRGYNLNSFKQMGYDLAAQGAPIHGLGVQCHMLSTFDPVIVKGRFDSVAELNLPIWVTEFDVSDPNENIRADKLEEFYRIAFSHPSVEGILMWGFWENQHWKENAYIVNADWTLNAAGLRYEALMNEWTTSDSAITDLDGNADFRGFFGTYTVTLSPQDAEPTVVTIELTPDGPTQFDVILDDIAESTAPGASANLVATAGNETVILQWDDNTEIDLDGYNIYRSVTPQTGYTKLNDSILTLSEHTDNDVTNYTSYFYVVTAINTNSDESDNSNQVSATPSNTTVIQLTSEDFESGFGDWLNISGLDTHDWFLNSGSTSTGYTGPDSGAGTSQWYMYLECSVNDGGANIAGDTAILQ